MVQKLTPPILQKRKAAKYFYPAAIYKSPGLLVSWSPSLQSLTSLHLHPLIPVLVGIDDSMYELHTSHAIADCGEFFRSEILAPD